MDIILTKLVSAIIAPVLLLTGALGITPERYAAEVPALGAVVPTSVALFETSLANAITDTATSMTLVSATTKNGTTLATSTYAFIIDEGTANEEFVTATCVATACTSMTRGLSVITGDDEVTALKKAHRRGASVKITDAPQLLILSRLVNGDESLPNVLKYDSISTTTVAADDNNLASVGFVNELAFGGIPAASESASGFAELATGLEAASSTPSGSGARLVLPTSISTSTAPASGHVIPVTGTDGNLAEGFLPYGSVTSSSGVSDAGKYTRLNATGTLSTSFNLYMFGSGSDGDATISATTTLSRDMFYNDLTVNSALVTSGYRIHVAGTLSGTGTIDWGTPNNGADGSGMTGGAGGTQSGSGPFKNTAGAAGGNGSSAGGGGGDGASRTSTIKSGAAGGNGGMDGTGDFGVGGSAGTATIPYPFIGSGHTIYGFANATSGPVELIYAAAGSGGGGGGASAGSGSGNQGAGGGGAGASGGLIYISAKTFSGSFTIKSVGGNGGNGANATGSHDEDGGGGGGAGGSGGSAIVIYSTKTWTGSYNLAGGTGGTGGNGISGGTAGDSGSNGLTGTYYEIN